jgi:16S rRNA (cytosine967-C5)-methyltransferase
MRPAGRLSAAIEVLDDILARHRPVADALSDWGKSHRFAGSSDRAAIGALVYDALRHRASTGWRMGADTPRALAIGIAVRAWKLEADEVAALCNGVEHAPATLSEAERTGLARSLDAAPDHIRADVPEWLWPAFASRFGTSAVAEGEALATRAPADIRVNTLKANRERTRKALAPFGATATPFSPVGLRVPPADGAGRTPNLQPEAAFQAGWIEFQDEASQLAALVASAAHPQAGQVLDYCAGGGGKSLALAAAKGNKGQIYAHDADRHRLGPIHQRLQRAGVRNVQVRPPRAGALDDLEGRMDLVLIDAPCTGTGVWRRRPEAKWRLTPEALAKRKQEQRAILADALRFVKPGGRLAYVTCSLIEEENEGQVNALLAVEPGFARVSVSPLWQAVTAPAETPLPRWSSGHALLMSPASTGTDGFYVAVFERHTPS